MVESRVGINQIKFFTIIFFLFLIVVDGYSENWRQNRREHYENYSSREKVIKKTGDLGRTPSAILIARPEFKKSTIVNKDKIHAIMYQKVRLILPEITVFYSLIDTSLTVLLDDKFSNSNIIVINQLDSLLIQNTVFDKYKYIAIFYGLSHEYKENEVATRAIRWIQQRGEPDKPYYAHFVSLSFSIFSRETGELAFHSRLTENHKKIEVATEEVVEELLEEFEQVFIDD